MVRGVYDYKATRDDRNYYFQFRELKGNAIYAGVNQDIQEYWIYINEKIYNNIHINQLIYGD